jgi:uncharacterized protein
MDSLIAYSIPVQGLQVGLHEFNYDIDREFFDNFEDSPIEDGNIQLRLEFDKRPDLYVLWFRFEGSVKTDCDRCLTSIDLPVKDEQRLLVKLREEEQLSDDPDVIFIRADAQKLNVAPYIYEFISLALPLIKVYDCEADENPKCDQDMLKYLDAANQKDEEEKDNPIWEELKKLKQ